jgi:hypothetical protein
MHSSRVEARLGRACGPVPVSVRAAAQQRKQRLFSDNGCRASSFRRAHSRARAATLSRSWRMRPAACCTPRSRRVRRRWIDRHRLRSAHRADYRRAAAAASAQCRRLGWHGTHGTQCTTGLPASPWSASPVVQPATVTHPSPAQARGNASGTRNTNEGLCADRQLHAVGGACAPRRPASAGLCAIPQACAADAVPSGCQGRPCQAFSPWKPCAVNRRRSLRGEDRLSETPGVVSDGPSRGSSARHLSDIVRTAAPDAQCYADAGRQEPNLARILCDDGEPSVGRVGGEPSLGRLEAV